MEFGKNLHFSCRVCAVNVEKRRSSLALVPIFSTPTLAENLRKHLSISVAYGDGLPEKVCKNCFKRLESFHNFACLAKKTENFFKEFLKTTKTNSVQSMEKYGIHFQSEPLPVSLHRADDPLIVKTTSGKKESEQVVLNFTLNNPLTRDIESKIIKAREATSLKHRNNNDQIMVANKNSSASEISTETRDGAVETVQKKISVDQKQKYLKMALNNKNTAPQPLPYMTEIPAGVSQMFQASSSPPRVPIATPTNLFSQEMQQQMAQTLKQGSVIYDCLNLGSVIKDIDLLKLILKALKWPYTPATLGETLQKLKETRFRDVILDKNLLQDTDMMQILNTYLSPILLQTQNTPAPLPTIVSYNIPKDTSVHIVSVPHDEPAEQQISLPRRHSSPKAVEHFQNHQPQRQQSNADYRQRHYQRHSLPPTILRRRRRLKTKAPSQVVTSDGPIVVSDDDSDANAETFEVSIDPALYFPQYGETQEKQSISKQRPNNKKLIRKQSLPAEKRRSVEMNKSRKQVIDKQMIVEKDPLQTDEQDPLQTDEQDPLQADEILIIDPSEMSVAVENAEKLKNDDNSKKGRNKRLTNLTEKKSILTPIDTLITCDKVANIPASVRKSNIPIVKPHSTLLKAQSRPIDIKENNIPAVKQTAKKPTATSTNDIEEITLNGTKTPPVSHVEMPTISSSETPASSRIKSLPKSRTVNSIDTSASSHTPTLPIAASQITPAIPTISRVASVIVSRTSSASNANTATPTKQIAAHPNHRITALINSHNRSVTPASSKTDEDGETIAEVVNEDSETITIEDDDDDAVWADFKVVDSPEYIGPDDPITLVKPFIVKKEEEDEATEEPRIECDPSIVKIESDHIKKEVQEEESIEEAKDEKLEVIDSGAITPPPVKRRGRRRKANAVENLNSENTNKMASPAATEKRQSKRKSAVISYSPPAKKPAIKRATRTPKVEKESLGRKSKTTSKYYNTPEPKVERDVKQRKRICKQCGFSFDNLVKFMEHRKKFHN